MTAVIVDDDPTGAQTLRDVALIFGVDPALLNRHLDAGELAVCVLTNSRALSADAARSANQRVAAALRERAGAMPLLVSRGDSTLRGHVAVEVGALRAALPDGAGVRRVFVPAFIEAGRTTRAGRHFVDIAGQPVPVGETPFATDARFGFSSSDLPDFLAEVGAVADAGEVDIVPLELVAEGTDAVASAIANGGGSWTVVDATTVAHIDAIAAALQRLHAAGVPMVVRCAPSLVRALARRDSLPALTDDELRAAFPARRGHGLVVVGSHVPQTTRQLASLTGVTGLARFEAGIDALTSEDPGDRAALVEAVVAALQTNDVVLETPRAEVRDTSAGGDLARRLSDSLCEIVAAVHARAELGWVIAKGGITSHETAAQGLGIRSASVVGQLFDGKVSIIRPIEALRRTIDLPYVIFPGNVGGDDDLRIAVERLRRLTFTDEETS
ncbi:four-carbon acid sugar kinase family protein [Microbacterium atlanticum]|uniref:four-carbon acid sugar kinase family protein n=1 Tax=Microbacterium atlanticum TaxID=2782168 RepID=UPI001886C231|nr:four-carbon acid sugar kinase family protein [Microbacterium atlanticum]